MDELISVVVPIYNEQEVIYEFYERITKVLESVIDYYDYEIIFVDDGSYDNSLKILKKLCLKNNKIKAISFSRNFGHQLAVTAGIDHAEGDAIIIIDADLQDPPETIIEMLKTWKKNFNVVYCVREAREGENFFKLFSAKLFYRLLNKLSSTNIPLDTGDFRLIDKQVADIIRSMPEESRYIRGMISWVGFNQCDLKYKRDQRYAGKTKYNLTKMIGLALDGITSFSEKPLTIVIYTGIFAVIFSIIFIFYLILNKLILPDTVIQGWTSVTIMIVFFGGIQLISTGLIGLYVGRIFRQIKGRPLYLVSERHGFEHKKK